MDNFKEYFFRLLKKAFDGDCRQKWFCISIENATIERTSDVELQWLKFSRWLKAYFFCIVESLELVQFKANQTHPFSSTFDLSWIENLSPIGANVHAMDSISHFDRFESDTSHQ